MPIIVYVRALVVIKVFCELGDSEPVIKEYLIVLSIKSRPNRITAAIDSHLVIMIPIVCHFYDCPRMSRRCTGNQTHDKQKRDKPQRPHFPSTFSGIVLYVFFCDTEKREFLVPLTSAVPEAPERFAVTLGLSGSFPNGDKQAVP